MLETEQIEILKGFGFKEEDIESLSKKDLKDLLQDLGERAQKTLVKARKQRERNKGLAPSKDSPRWPIGGD